MVGGTYDIANGLSANGVANSGCEGSLCRWRQGNSRAANHCNIVRSRPSTADHSSDSVVAHGFGHIARLVGSVHDAANPPNSSSNVEPNQLQNRLGSAPLPHLFPRLDQLRDRPRAREVSRPDATDKVRAPVEILHGGRAHHREASLQICQILPAEHLVRRSGTPSHGCRLTTHIPACTARRPFDGKD